MSNHSQVHPGAYGQLKTENDGNSASILQIEFQGSFVHLMPASTELLLLAPFFGTL